MSHLHEILNHDHGRPQSSKLDDHTEPVVDRLDISSSPDEVSPGSDDEIDELDEESDGGGDFYDEEPPTPLRGTTNNHPVNPTTQQGSIDGATEPNLDLLQHRKEEKRPEPAPRRKLEKHDRKIDLGLHDHKAHADCPDTLACLPDTHGRPQHTLPVILRCAILGSPRKRLTIREIYATMESKYPYYKTAGQTWKQSVRHHLSLNRLFERQPRPVTDPGFGSYWTVNLTAPPGTKRPRKRGRPNKDGIEGSTTKKSSPSKNESLQQQQLQLISQPLKFHFQPQSHPPPPPPPLPQPQVNALAHHHHSVLNLSSPMPEYHSTSDPHLHSLQQASLQQAQPNTALPTSASSSSSASQDNRRHEHHHPNHYQNHRQHQGGPHHRHSPVSATHLGHRQPLSPSIPPQSHQYSQEQQQIYPHQRTLQDRYSPTSQHGAHHPSQIVPSQSRPSLNHSHSQPIGEQRDIRRHGGSYPPHRKNSLPLREPTYPLSSRDSDGDEMMVLNSGVPTISVSDDEFESEEDTDNHYPRRPHNGTFIPTKPSPIFPPPPFSVLSPPQRQELVEQMRQEIADLRRTSAEAVSTSIRLSEQLANANLEVSRSREAVRDLEDMLQDEAAKRKESEKIRTVEVERRRAAEDALSSTIRSPARVRAT